MRSWLFLAFLCGCWVPALAGERLERPEVRGERQYESACELAQQGKLDEALIALNKSVEEGFNEPARMRADEALAVLRSEQRFRELLAKARENEKKFVAGTYDPPPALPGVKTIEGFPEGGLRYVLRMSPTATPEKPNRLIVWLHPSRGSANKYMDRVVPRLLRSGFALLMPTHKQWGGWWSDEAEKLLKHTVPEVAGIKGIDARKPVLMGFSAGANMLQEVYGQAPEEYSGFVLDGGHAPEWTPGEGLDQQGKSFKQTPVLAILGELDGRAAGWREAEPQWKKAGVPLTTIYVPKRGHTWLIEAQIDAIIKWLESLPKLEEEIEIRPKTK